VFILVLLSVSPGCRKEVATSPSIVHGKALARLEKVLRKTDRIEVVVNFNGLDEFEARVGPVIVTDELAVREIVQELQSAIKSVSSNETPFAYTMSGEFGEMVLVDGLHSFRLRFITPEHVACFSDERQQAFVSSEFYFKLRERVTEMARDSKVLTVKPPVKR
jgi:hypothetical protein